jgi:hypothetical protein
MSPLLSGKEVIKMKTKKLPDEFQVHWKKEIPDKSRMKFDYCKARHAAEAFRIFRKQKRKGKEDLVIIRYKCEANLIPMLGWCPFLDETGRNHSGKPGDWKSSE